MNCASCGTEIKDDDTKFCSYCGSPISRPVAPSPQVRVNNDYELRRLREEVTALRYEAKKSSNWAQSQKSCCQCFIALMIIGVVFATIMMWFFWDVAYPW